MNKIDAIDHVTSKNLDKYRNIIPRTAFIEAIPLLSASNSG